MSKAPPKAPIEFVEFGDGFATIALAVGITVSGAKITSVRMREPEVRDELAADAAQGTAAAKEVAAFANLCDLTPQDIHGMKMRDYRRLAAAYSGFGD